MYSYSKDSEDELSLLTAIGYEHIEYNFYDCIGIKVLHEN